MAQHVHAFGDDALGELDAVGLAEAIRVGTVSRTEAAEAAIARLEAVNPVLNGLAYQAFDRALTTAAARPSDGFFDGVPTFVKDTEDVAGMPTMWGTDAWLPRSAREDGAFAQVYLATGVNPLGKTQLSQLGLNTTAEHPRLGAVGTPWNTDHTAGGSSSGAGAFVAAGVVPIAHANDGGGSTRIPASCNGLVGLKASRGRLPLNKTLRQMPLHIVYEGVLTRSVRDTAAFYREAERIWRNPKLPPIGDVTHAGMQRLRIAVCTHSPTREATREIRELTLNTAAILDELGHRVEFVDQLPLSPTFADDFVLYWASLAMAMVRRGRHTFGPSFDRTRLDEFTLGLDHYAIRNLHRIPLAVGRLAASRRYSARFFQGYDALLTPTVAEQTPRVGHLDPTAHWLQVIQRVSQWVFTPVQNATGDPSISLPLAQTAAGLPQGMMLSAGRGAEARLLELAYELEEAHPWSRIQDAPSSHDARRTVTH